MKRPLLIRMAPAGCRTWLYYHVYRSRRPQLRALFDDAELAFALGVRMRLLPTDESHGCIATAGFYELPLTRTIARLGKQGGLLVDFGSNYGYFTLLWAAQKPGNRVIAFEASPRNQQALRHNVEKNAFAGVGKALRMLGWAPRISPREGFEKTATWHISHTQLLSRLLT